MRMDNSAIRTKVEFPDGHRWLKCIGCKGEVGLPHDWDEPSVSCPRCGEVIITNPKILYRPEERPAPPPVPPRPPLSLPLQPTAAGPSLIGKADVALAWGVACMFFGWTVIVPLISVCCLLNVNSAAKAQNAAYPTRAVIATILTVTFGFIQAFAMFVAIVNHH
jgi:hypothetical protein